METLSRELLIDKYNEALRPFLDKNEYVCPQCFSPFKETKDGRHYFRCGTSLKKGTPGIISTARCYLKALDRPLDIGNLNPHGYLYEDLQ